jgi:hypothetical protein
MAVNDQIDGTGFQPVEIGAEIEFGDGNFLIPVELGVLVIGPVVNAGLL